jgi:DNA mismatch repair protein MutS
VALAELPAPVAIAAELGALAVRAAGGALAYVDAAYRRRPAHLGAPEPYALGGFLQLDAATRRNLELLQTLGGERRGSLVVGARRGAHADGRATAARVDPLPARRAGRDRPAARRVEELVERPELRQTLRDALVAWATSSGSPAASARGRRATRRRASRRSRSSGWSTSSGRSAT